MSLTKEMMIRVEDQVSCYDDKELVTYNNTYRDLNKHYPNSYYLYMVDKSAEEIIRRGLHTDNTDK